MLSKGQHDFHIQKQLDKLYKKIPVPFQTSSIFISFGSALVAKIRKGTIQEFGGPPQNVIDDTRPENSRIITGIALNTYLNITSH